MSLIKCQECGHDVSTQAEKCPNCGIPVKKAEEQQTQQSTTGLGTYSSESQIQQKKSGLTWPMLAGITGFVLIVAFILALVGGSDSDESGQKSKTPSFSRNQGSSKTEEKSAVAEQPKQWVEIIRFAGNGHKKSEPFELTGAPARLRYELVGEQEMTMLAIYVVKEGQDIMETGGFPEVIINDPETGESRIYKQKGSYYLDVNSANGNWNIVLEEQR